MLILISKGVKTASVITKYLKKQFAGLFQRFREEQTKIKEDSLIANLVITSQNLNQLGIKYWTSRKRT